MAHPASSESRDPGPGAAATAFASASAPRPADLAALTTRDDFLLELGEVLAGRASVHPAETLEAAIECLHSAVGRRILAIDARETGEVRGTVERAAQRLGDAQILVFTEAGTEKQVAAAVKGTSVFAVLSLPMEPDKTGAVIDAALTSSGTTESAERPARPALRPAPTLGSGGSHAPRADDAHPAPPGRRTDLRRAALLGVVALAVGAGAFWWLMRPHPGAPAALRPTVPQTASQRSTLPARPHVDAEIVTGRVSDLLIKASQAMFERHFTTPKGANALVYYRSVLAVDPDNAEAQNGLQRVSHVLVSRFAVDLSRHHYAGAALALATLQLAEPANPHIGPFRIELARAQVAQALAHRSRLPEAPALIAQAARWGVPAAQIQLWQGQLAALQHRDRAHALARRLATRVAAGRLIGAHSAASTLAKLRVLAPQAPATDAAAQTLIGALIARAQHAGRAGRMAAQRQWLHAARDAGATPAQIAAVEQQLARLQSHAAAARLERLLARARAALARGALLAPAHASAAYDLSVFQAAHPDPALRAAAAVLRTQLASALVSQAKAAERTGQHAAALEDLAAARRWGASSAALDAANLSPRAPAAPTAAQLAQVARQLRRIHYVPPRYPQRALASGLSGEVTVRYVVDAHGHTRQLQVIAARPGTLFNRAALAAIRRWRYTPPTFDGRPIAVPVMTQIRFELPN